jgi:hypothetical protein
LNNNNHFTFGNYPTAHTIDLGGGNASLIAAIVLHNAIFRSSKVPHQHLRLQLISRSNRHRTQTKKKKASETNWLVYWIQKLSKNTDAAAVFMG